MSRKRKSKARRERFDSGAQLWFIANVRRQRRRRDLAFESRRRNRGK
jgi:hypothetical protein